MDAQVLDHLGRIERLVAGLATLPWIEASELERVHQTLLDFDAVHWPIVRVLSLPLYQELTGLLTSGEAKRLLAERPWIAVVMPVHEPRPELLRKALASLIQQVGVGIECWVSVDGRQQDQQLVASLLRDLGGDQPGEHWRSSVLLSDRNRGVGLCRNLALQQISTAFFTCLDDDDVFHPLRCLHALLVLLREQLMRLNTGWCRASLLENKLVLINQRLSHTGHNSFIARREILDEYGYLSNLRFLEDTELMNRHIFYGVSMRDSPVAGHYLHSEPHQDYESLAAHCRQEVHAINGHPYLCGTVLAELPDNWQAISREYQERYLGLSREQLPLAFPAIPEDIAPPLSSQDRDQGKPSA